MSLTPNVQECLDNAAGELRSALYHAARNEKPQTIQQIAELLAAVDKVAAVNDILTHLDKMKNKGKLDWTDFD